MELALTAGFGATMNWNAGPTPSQEIHIQDYDERDPWTRRFISKTETGELALDVQAMNGLETAAGAVFVDLIRKQAEKAPSPGDVSWVGVSGHLSSHLHHHPSAMKEKAPMAQYEPFRNTYVRDPRCVPQLKYAQIPETGADHHKREANQHWRRAGRTWSRVPRFRKGETAFTHDPSYKPPHAVGDRWYRTEVGTKASLMGRVQESRWQSSHSLATGREPRQPNRSRIPRDPEGAGPSPASYRLQDLWEVKEVCGQIPKSSMFCTPTRRIRPRTTASMFSDKRSNALFDTSTANITAADSHDAWACRPSTSISTAIIKKPRARVHDRHSLRTSESGTAKADVPRKFRSAPVGPASFARAERPYVVDEPKYREESYGRQVVRLMTPKGDVVVTVNRRRTTDWNYHQAHSRCDGRGSAGSGHDDGSGNRRRRKTITRRKENRRLPARDGFGGAIDGRTGPRRAESVDTMQKALIKTPQAEASALLPDELSPALPWYRDPGQSELPVLFRATTAPISQAGSRGLRRNRKRNPRVPAPSLLEVESCSTEGTGYPSRENGVLQKRSSADEAAYVANIVNAAKAVVAGTAESSGVRRIPSPSHSSRGKERLSAEEHTAGCMDRIDPDPVV